MCADSLIRGRHLVRLGPARWGQRLAGPETCVLI